MQYDLDRDLVWCPECEDVFAIRRYDNEMEVFVLACGHTYDPYQPGEPLEESSWIDDWFDIIVMIAFMILAAVLMGMFVMLTRT